MWGIIGGLFKPLGDIFKEREKRKTALAKAKAKQEEILAAAASADSTVAGQIALVNANNQNNTWKDEFALITIALPFWVMMVGGLLGFQDTIGPMFQQMKEIPEFWQQTFQWGILGALGITQLKKAITR